MEQISHNTQDTYWQGGPVQAAPVTQGFKLTQLGNAERLIGRHGHNIRYCHAWKKWLIWNGKQWKPDDTGQIMGLAKDTVRSIYKEAAALHYEGHALNHARASESRYELEAMTVLAQDRVPVMPQELDSDPFMFNCQNGTIDLPTGKLQPHRPERMLSKISPVTFDEKAGCPIWAAFLDRLFGGSADLVSFMQMAIGYSLTGAVTEKALFVLCGDGDNGKTTLLEAFRYIMGDYAGSIEINSLMQSASSSDQQRTVADLLGKRFVTASEAEEGQKLNEAKIKQLTGMGKQVGRRLYGHAFEFDPQFKLFIDANHKPVIRGSDPAIWNRIRLVPFAVSIPKAEQDRGLLAKLRVEAPGILSWAVQGCLEWQREGFLGTPAAITEAVESYREEMDIVAQFIADCCAVDPGLEAEAGELYLHFQQWCDQRREQPNSSTAFAKRLGDKGYEAGPDIPGPETPGTCTQSHAVSTNNSLSDRFVTG
jgi:putative DNA primase/helicase